jgi:multiple sugar transport system substrate-binding protein
MKVKIKMSKDEKIDFSRRSFLKTVGTAVVGLAVGAGVGYGVYPTINPSGAERTVTVTTGEGPGGITSIPVEGKEPHERLMNAMKFVAERDGLKGKDFTLMHPGGGSACYAAVKEEFESETGLSFVNAEVPLNEIFDKAMLEAVSKTGDYDAFSLQPMMLGDIAESGLVIPLDDYIKWFDSRFHGLPDGYIYPLDYIMAEYKGKKYLTPQDGDVQALYVRTDLLNDPANQDNFETQYGYPLKPANTIQEYWNHGEFFNNPDEDFYGIVEFRSAERCYMVWFIYYTSMKYPNMLPFDENMEPLIDSDEGIQATEEFVESLKYMPSETPSWDWQVGYQMYSGGQIFTSMNFPSLSNMNNNPEISKIIGKWSAEVIPGHKVKGPDDKEIILRRSVQGAGWGILVSDYSKMKDFAALWALWFTSPEKSSIAVSYPASWMDPTRYNHVGPNADERVMKARGPILQNFEQNASMCAPVVSGIRGCFEYNTTLSRNLHATMSGTMDPTECMERTAEEWNDITERIGREKQVEAWKDFMKTYPTTII